DRYAISGQLFHRWEKLASTLRFEHRLYVDSWSIAAADLDAMFARDVSRIVRVSSHVRGYGQTGASFWDLAYVSTAGNVPSVRAGDRSLGPLVTVTSGVGFHLAFGRYGVGVAADTMLTHYFRALYLTTRESFYSTIAVDAVL